MINSTEDSSPPMETAETIKKKVAQILEVDPKYLMLADFELKELPALQDPSALQRILEALEYGKAAGKLDTLCNSLGAPMYDGKCVAVFDLGPALNQLMNDLGIDPKGGAK